MSKFGAHLGLEESRKKHKCDCLSAGRMADSRRGEAQKEMETNLERNPLLVKEKNSST